MEITVPIGSFGKVYNLGINMAGGVDLYPNADLSAKVSNMVADCPVETTVVISKKNGEVLGTA